MQRKKIQTPDLFPSTGFVVKYVCVNVNCLKYQQSHCTFWESADERLHSLDQILNECPFLSQEMKIHSFCILKFPVNS